MTIEVGLAREVRGLFIGVGGGRKLLMNGDF